MKYMKYYGSDDIFITEEMDELDKSRLKNGPYNGVVMMLTNLLIL